MPFHFSQNDTVRLRGDAKALRHRDQSLTQTQALNLIAQREGWPNWALLERNVTPLRPGESLDSSVERFKGGDPGVFLLQLNIRDEDVVQSVLRTGGLSFEFPNIPAKWLVRRFTERDARAADPFLDLRTSTPRGRFVDGKFLCILSTNGVQPNEVDSEVNARLDLLAASFRHSAVRALALLREKSLALGVTLLYVAVNATGIRSIEQRQFDSVAQARAARLDENELPVLITSPDVWLMFQRPFGWTEMRPPY